MTVVKEQRKSRSTGRVLLYLRTGEDIVIVQDLLAGMAAEGVVCTDLQDLCRRMTREDVDAVLLTEPALADGALPILAKVLHSQPQWSDLPVLFVAGGGLESPLAVQVMRELPNVLVLNRPVRTATLASTLGMALRIRDKQRQVRDLLAEQQQREQVLRESEERFRALVTASSEVLYRMSPDWREMRQLHSRGFLANTEKPSRTWLSEYIHPDDQAHVTAVIQQAIRTKSVFELEHRVRRADGSLGWTFSRAVPLLGANGEIVEWFGAASDVTARRQAEEALRRSERQFKSTFENAAIGIARVALDGHILQFNSRFSEIAGYSPDDIIGKTCEEITFADDWESERVQMQRLWDGQIDHYAIEKRYLRRDGSPVWVNLTRSIQHDEGGRPEYFIVIVEDISERKWMEGALRKSEQWFRTLANAMPQLVWTADPDGRVDYYNDRYQEFRGIERMPDGSFRWAPVLHEEDRAATVAAWEHAVRTGEPYQVEHRARRTDGNYHWYLSRGTPVRDSEGRIVKWFGTTTDIDNLKRAQEALRASEQRYRKLFEANLAGVYLTKPDGTILDFNDAMRRMLGYDSRAEVFAHRSTDFYADPKFRDVLLRLLQKDGMVPAKEAVLRRKDGSVLYALGAGVLLKDEQTGELYIQGVAIDITERKRAEEALREWNVTLESKVAQRTAELKHRARQLQKLTLDMSETEDRERKRMAEILHDDLQQQLAAAKFHLGLMRNRVKYDASVQAIGAQVDHMLKDAIDKSRSLSHELSPTVLHHADFAETLRWLGNEVQAKHGLLVHVRAPDAVRLQSEALKSFLYRAAQELLFNVVKHAGVGQAEIRVRPCRRCVCLAVSDRGRGFDPQELRETAGFGLLSIRERIELLGGRMKIKSVKGKGSAFLIVVPNGEIVGTGSKVKTKPDGRAKGAEEDHGRLRVLLADDHEIVREGLRALLSDEHDVEVVGEAANGREAVDLANQLKPDVIIMDMSMPVIEGDEATRQIKAYLPDTRVIAISMYDQSEKIEAMYRAGAESYVLKTAPSDELLAAIRGQAHRNSRDIRFISGLSGG